MKYYRINEIENIERPIKIGYETVIVKDEINDIAFFDFKETLQCKEIVELKRKLLNTDYKAIKYAEGQLTEEEYASTKAERQGWRDRINELEAQIMSQATESEATQNG